MKNQLLIVLLFFPLIAWTQGEANYWYFGQNAGLNFNTNPPTVLTNGSLNTPEGCASIADASGNLLFYTDGTIVFNQEHQIMLNGEGLAGDSTSTQAALIIPMPLSDHIYYIFTTGSNGGVGTPNDGLRYSIVDMNLENGNGAVIEKNIFLINLVSEKLKAVPHANGRDFWLLTHQFDSNGFYSFLVSCQGVQKDPIITRVGRLHKETSAGCCKGFSANGALAVAKNNRKVAVIWNEVISFSLQAGSTVTKWKAEVLDFNNRTGKLSNPIAMQSENTNGEFAGYGACFSPDNSKLYFTVKEAAPVHRLIQYDLSSDDIPGSRTEIATENGGFAYGTIEIGPDGKIYIARLANVDFLSILHQPNGLGFDCGFERKGILLEGKRSSLGLPNILYDYDSTPFYEFFRADTMVCFREELFLDADTLNATSYLWDDGSSFSDNTIDSPGWHWLAIETETCGDGRDSIYVEYVDCSCRVVFPNAFSPNGDGANDTFEAVLASCEYSIYELNIYSRWGDLVFSTKDPAAAWDGALKGKKLPSGTYVYYLLYKNPKEKGLKKIVGNISLLR